MLIIITQNIQNKTSKHFATNDNYPNYKKTTYSNIFLNKFWRMLNRLGLLLNLPTYDEEYGNYGKII